MTGLDILVVDDNPDACELLRRNLVPAGHRVRVAGSVDQALAALAEAPAELVITDLRMPRTSGLELVRHLHVNSPGIEIIMITGHATLASAVEAVRAGAGEYLAKPFTDAELAAVVAAAAERVRRRRALSAAFDPVLASRAGLLGNSSAMQELLRNIERAAASRATVLITGESGTGKELVARAVHYASPRAACPFLPVHCGGIPDTLLESELFGHVKGAFTGADESRAGYFQAADSGTLFLDEIGDVSPPMQIRLLRVLQEREICMVGSPKPIRVDVRIVAATHKDLRRLVQQERFREDLYFRLHVLVLEVPALRERDDDVLLLARHFADQFAADAGRPPPHIGDDALEALQRYPWPGNVRELQNVIQRAVVMTDDAVLDAASLPAAMRFSVPSGPAELQSLADVQRDHVRRVLRSVEGNKTAAARILGIDRKTLRGKLEGG